MGQLEKYGLYVLCLVIFLILGVSLWGGGELPTNPASKASQSVAIHAPSAATQPRTGENGALPRSLQDLLGPGAGAVPGSGSPTSPPANGANSADGANDAGSNGSPNASPASTDPAAGKPKDAAATKAAATDGGRVAYTVQAKDRLDTIAQAKLGSSRLWPEIQKLNPGLDPTKLRPGKEIWLPSTSAVATLDRARKAKPDIAPLPEGKRVYTVKKGDSYDRIATAQLGSQKRSKELQNLNPGVAAEKLRPGMRLTLPLK